MSDLGRPHPKSTRADRWSGRRWSSYAGFYADVYGEAVVERRNVGTLGVQLIATRQDRGDWSDAAVPDLTIARLVSPRVRGVLDYGGGPIAGTKHRGDFIVSAPNIPTTVVLDDPHALEIITLPYAALLALGGPGSGLPADGDFGPLHARLTRCDTIATVFRGLWDLAQRDEPYAALAAAGRTLELAAALLALRDKSACRGPGEGLAGWRLKRAMEALETSTHPPSLAELSAQLGLSPAHFARAFRASTGLPPHAWATQRRLERARDTLGQGSAPIADIAAEAGYASQQGFTTAFRRAFGVTPARYRRDRKE